MKRCYKDSATNIGRASLLSLDDLQNAGSSTVEFLHFLSRRLSGDRLLVMGGRTTPDQVTDQMWWFTPRTGRWTRAGTLPYPVADAPATL